MTPALKSSLTLILLLINLLASSQIIRSVNLEENELDFNDRAFTLDQTGFILACRSGNTAAVNCILEKCPLEIIDLNEGFLEAAGQGNWLIVLALLRLEDLSPSVEHNHVFTVAIGAEKLDVLKVLMAHHDFQMNSRDLIVRASQSHSPKVLEAILKSGRIDALDPNYFYLLLAVLECDHASLTRTAMSHPGIIISTEPKQNIVVQLVDLLRTRMPSVQNIFVSHPGADVSIFSELDRRWNNDLAIIEACRLENFCLVQASIPTFVGKIDLLDLGLRIAINTRSIKLFRILESAIYQVRDQFSTFEPQLYPHLNAVIPAWKNSQIFAMIPSDTLLKDIQRYIIFVLWLTCSYT